MWMTRPGEAPVDRAKRRAGYAAIVLVVLAVVSLTQAGAIVGAAPGDLFASAGAGEAAAVTMASGLMLIAGTTALALVAAWMVWRTRSRLAICVGLGLVALNFVEYALVLMAGEFSLRGVVVNLVAGGLLVLTLRAAREYHGLKDAVA
jgi:hypothetical protein